MFTLNFPTLFVACLLAGPGAAAWAEKADRSRPMTLESDQPCTVSQGTMQIRADKLELRETPEGWQMAVATGTAAKPATYRQKRDGSDETVEGQAQRIDYDSRAGTLRFEGAAVVRRLRGSTVADEIQGQQIVWDSAAESFNVRGGAATATNPGGRVRAVITPRVPTDEAAPAAPAGGALKPSATLGDRR